MIMAKNPNGTYSQVGFIKDADGNDVEFVKNKNGAVIFEKGFTREKSGTLPLQIDGIGKSLKNYTIYGNTIQNGTPTPDNPVEVQAVGDRTENLFDYDSQIKSLATKGYYINADGEEVYNTAWYITDYIKIYGDTISFNNVSGTKPAVCLYDENFVFIKGEAFSNRHSLTVETSGASHVRFSFIAADSNIMLNLGTEPLPYEPYGYKIPITTESEGGTESITTTVYLDKPLYKSGDYADFVEYSTQTTTRYCGVDDSGVFLLESPVTESVTLPKIPTLDGTTVIDVETTVKPSKMDIKYKSKT